MPRPEGRPGTDPDSRAALASIADAPTMAPGTSGTLPPNRPWPVGGAHPTWVSVNAPVAFTFRETSHQLLVRLSRR